MLPLIAQRRTSDGDDLLSRMCRAEIDGERLSDAEICGFVSLMLTAGGETTDRALANMFANLIAHRTSSRRSTGQKPRHRRVRGDAPVRPPCT